MRVKKTCAECCVSLAILSNCQQSQVQTFCLEDSFWLCYPSQHENIALLQQNNSSPKLTKQNLDLTA